MSISGGNFKVENDLQQAFKSNVESNSAEIKSEIQFFESTVIYDTVGITPEMLSNITTAIDNYVAKLTSVLDGMPSAVDYEQAFRGEFTNKAVKQFVEQVKETCKNYITNLQKAENQIIESVSKQYNLNDNILRSEIFTDASRVK